MDSVARALARQSKRQAAFWPVRSPVMARQCGKAENAIAAHAIRCLQGVTMAAFVTRFPCFFKHKLSEAHAGCASCSHRMHTVETSLTSRRGFCRNLLSSVDLLQKGRFLALSHEMFTGLSLRHQALDGAQSLPVCPFPASGRPIRTQLGALNRRASGLRLLQPCTRLSCGPHQGLPGASP
jgi:hypothetical protein